MHKFKAAELIARPLEYCYMSLSPHIAQHIRILVIEVLKIPCVADDVCEGLTLLDNCSIAHLAGLAKISLSTEVPFYGTRSRH